MLVIQTTKHLTDRKSKIHNLKILRKVELYLWQSVHVFISNDGTCSFVCRALILNAQEMC